MSADAEKLTFSVHSLKNLHSASQRLAENYLNFFRALLRLGKHLTKDVSWLQAEEALAQALSLKPARLPELLSTFGGNVKRTGTPADSREILLNLNGMMTRIAGDYLELGRIYRDSGSHEEAHECFSRAISFNGGDIKGYLDRFIVRLWSADFAGAFQDAKTVLDLGLTTEAQMATLVYPFGEKNNPPWDSEQLRALHGKLGGFLKDNPDSVWAHFYRYAFQQVLDWDTRGFSAPLDKKARGRYVWMRWLEARSFLHAKEWDQALSGFMAVHKAYPFAMRIGFLAGDALLGLGRVEEALDIFERQEPKTGHAGLWLSWMGETHLRLGNYSKAVAFLDRAADLGEPFVLTFAWRGGAKFKLGRTAAALKDLTQAIRLAPRDVEAYNWRGQAYRVLGQHEKAMQDLNAARGLSADNLFSKINLALLKGDMGDRRGMRSDFQAIWKKGLLENYCRKTNAVLSDAAIRDILEKVLILSGDWLAPSDDLPELLRQKLGRGKIAA